MYEDTILASFGAQNSVLGSWLSPILILLYENMLKIIIIMIIETDRLVFVSFESFLGQYV